MPQHDHTWQGELQEVEIDEQKLAGTEHAVQVCVSVCVCVRTGVLLCLKGTSHICIHTHARACTNTRAHAHTHAHTHMHTHTHAQTHAYMHTHICTHKHTHTHTHTCTHTHTAPLQDVTRAALASTEAVPAASLALDLHDA